MSPQRVDHRDETGRKSVRPEHGRGKLTRTPRGEPAVTLPPDAGRYQVGVMRIAVAGMHRSGTSMIAALLYHAGLYLGPRKELMPPGPDNEDGYWENVRFVELNEELLRATGGGWDDPPREFDPHEPKLRAVRIKAEVLGREFDRRSPWGWKDPRNTVTLPFWLDLFPELRIVGCVRNPLEVALSLHRRNDFSYERGLALWLDHNRRLLDHAPDDQLVLTHYDAYFADPEAELRRVLSRCGVDPAALSLEKACAAVRPSLHHNRFNATDLLAANVSHDVIELYARLCKESGWTQPEGAVIPTNGSSPREQGPLNRAVVDAALRRQSRPRSRPTGDARMATSDKPQRNVAGLPSHTAAAVQDEAREAAVRDVNSDRESSRVSHLDREDEVQHLSLALATAQSAAREATSRLSEQERRIDLAERTVDQLRADVHQLRERLAERKSAGEKVRTAAIRNKKELRAKIRRLESPLSERNGSLAAQEDKLTAVAEEAARRLQGSIDEALSRMRRTLDRVEGTTAAAAEVSPEKARYARMRERIGAAIADAIPFGATVLIASKGDENLLRLAGRRAWHFPRTADGSYAWYYPGDSGSAIGQLEALRSQGADYLVFPASSVWWLTHYSDFRRHLESCYRRVLNDKETCIAFSLREKPTDQHGVRAVMERVLAELQDRAPSASILDWTGNSVLATQLNGQIVFSPLQSTPPLPYVNRSADVVVVRHPDRATLREARRIAASAVIKVNGAGDAEVEWIDHQLARAASASIVIVHRDRIARTERCLAALFETIQPSLDVKFIVVDDASTDESASVLKRLSNRDARLQIVRNTRPLGVVASRNRGAKRVTSEFVVFLDGDTLPTPGWLQPLLRTFISHPDAGVVGGKLVLEDGRLKAAGGIVFADGSTADFGEWEQRVDAPLFSHTRDIDYCPGALLITPRKVFLSLGGFDARLEVAPHADADFCFKIWDSGRRVVYQPDSLVVNYGSDSPDANASAKARALFGEAWERVIRTRPRRPARLDGQTWLALGVREPWEVSTR